MDKTFGHIVPVRFVAFALVGAIGVAVHFAMLTLLFRFADLRFAESQAAATVFTMSVNFVLNNQLTYRDQRLHGLQWVRGWLSFNLACGVGGIMNVGLATYLYQISGTWYFAAIAGIVVGAVWNYAVTKSLTWNNRAA
jgi:dolichol-phosphate mannosyltransferase